MQTYHPMRVFYLIDKYLDGKMKPFLLTTALLVCLLLTACALSLPQVSDTSPEEAPTVEINNGDAAQKQSIDAQIDHIPAISLGIPAVSQRFKNFEGDNLYNQCVNVSLAMILTHYDLYDKVKLNTPERLSLDIRKKMMSMDSSIKENSGLTSKNISNFFEKYYPALGTIEKGSPHAQDYHLTVQTGDAPTENRYFLLDLSNYLKDGSPVIAFVNPKQLIKKGNVVPYDYTGSLGHAIVVQGLVKEDNQWFVEVNDPLVLPVESVLYTYDSLFEATYNYMLIQRKTE